jgi:hypothetical protein
MRLTKSGNPKSRRENVQEDAHGRRNGTGHTLRCRHAQAAMRRVEITETRWKHEYFVKLFVGWVFSESKISAAGVREVVASSIQIQIRTTVNIAWDSIKIRFSVRSCAWCFKFLVVVGDNVVL